MFGVFEAIEGLFPFPLVEEVVPLRDEVVDRTSIGGVTEGNTAVHATGPLLSPLLLGKVDVELLEIPYPIKRISIDDPLAGIFLESSRLPIVSPPRAAIPSSYLSRTPFVIW